MRHRQVLITLDKFRAIADREHDESAAPAGERLRVTTRFYLGEVRATHEELKRLAQRYDTVTRRSRIARFQVDRYVGLWVSLSLVEWVCGHPDRAIATAQAALDGPTTIGHVVSQATCWCWPCSPSRSGQER